MSDADLDVYAVRKAVGKKGETQASFARAIGVRLKTLQNWEQKRRKPTGPAKVLLSLIERNPQIVSELGGRTTRANQSAAGVSRERGFV